jgi:putative inorganic carbon (hco3(-)) transporter
VIDLRKHNEIFEKISIALLIVLVIYTPLPFGSVEYSSIFLIEIIAALLFFCWMMSLVLRYQGEHTPNVAQKKIPFLLRHPWLIHTFRIFTFGKWPTRNTAPNIVMEEDHRSKTFSLLGYPIKNTGLEKIGLLFFLLILLQLIPIPHVLQNYFSPNTAQLYSSAAKITGTSAALHPLSLDPFVTFAKFLEYASYFIIFLVVVNTIKTRRHLQIILVAFFVSAVFQGVYGLYEFLSGNQQIFSYNKKYNLDCVTGTFINRNHFAAYLELSIPLLLALVVGRLQRLKLFGGKILVRVAHALETEGSKILLLLFLIALVVVALVFSLSRSGITFAILSAIAFFFLYYRTNNQLTRKMYWIITAAGIFALSVWIGLDPILERFFRITDQFSDKEARLFLWKNTFNIFLHFPVTGTGAGTFKEVFPMYRTFPTHLSFTEAHNDYLQLLSETGILLVLILIAFLSSMFRRLRKVTTHGFDRIVVIQIGCFCSILSLGLHSLTDFSFQIPAVAVAGIIITALFFGNYHGERSHIVE